MLQENYRTVYQGGTGEIIEKKSRFIANVLPITSEEDAGNGKNVCDKTFFPLPAKKTLWHLLNG